MGVWFRDMPDQSILQHQRYGHAETDRAAPVRDVEAMRIQMLGRAPPRSACLKTTVLSHKAEGVPVRRHFYDTATRSA